MTCDLRLERLVKQRLCWPLKGCSCCVASWRPISFDFCLAAVAASWECCKINSSWRHSCWSLVSAYCLTGRRLGNTTRGGGWAPSLCLAHALCCKLKGECSEITRTPKSIRGYSEWVHLTEWNNLFFLVMLFKCACFQRCNLTFSRAFLTGVGNKWSDVARCEEGKVAKVTYSDVACSFRRGVCACICLCCVDVRWVIATLT